MSFRRGGAAGGRSGPMTEEERNAGQYAFPTATYPPTAMPLQLKATREERMAASHFISFRGEVREGPLFTGSLGTVVRTNGVTKQVVVELEEDNGVQDDGIKRYTDRYRKKRKVGRTVDEHPYVIEFFPKELYDVMGVVGTEDGGHKQKKKKKFVAKKLDIAEFKAQLLKAEISSTMEELAKFEEEGGVLDEEARKEAIERIKANQKEGANSKEEEEDAASESEGEDDIEDEFDEDEDDDDDYNAEKYFDDGEGGDDDDDGNDEAAY